MYLGSHYSYRDSLYFSNSVVWELEQTKLANERKWEAIVVQHVFLTPSAPGTAVALRRLTLFLGSGWVIPVRQQLDAHVIVQF